MLAFDALWLSVDNCKPRLRPDAANTYTPLPAPQHSRVGLVCQLFVPHAVCILTSKFQDIRPEVRCCGMCDVGAELGCRCQSHPAWICLFLHYKADADGDLVRLTVSFAITVLTTLSIPLQLCTEFTPSPHRKMNNGTVFSASSYRIGSPSARGFGTICCLSCIPSIWRVTVWTAFCCNRCSHFNRSDKLRLTII